MWGKFVKILEWIGHGSTAVQIAGWIGLPTAGFAGFAVTFFSSAAEGWSVTAVWIASVTTGALLAVLYAALMIGLAYRRSKDANPAPIHGEHVPDIRVADSPNTLALFDSNQLIALLEAEKITCWGRKRGMGETPLLRVPGDTWRAHRIEFYPHGGVVGRINQTFLKRGSESHVYYDVHLNRLQLRKIWPDFEPEYEGQISQPKPEIADTAGPTPEPYYTAKERETALDVLSDIDSLMRMVGRPESIAARKVVDNWGAIHSIGRDEYVRQLKGARDGAYRFNAGLPPILSRLPHGQIQLFPESGPPHDYILAFSAMIEAIERLPNPCAPADFDARIGPLRTRLLNASKKRDEWLNYISTRIHQETQRFRNLKVAP